jgi:hypothetical protein
MRWCHVCLARVAEDGAKPSDAASEAPPSPQPPNAPSQQAPTPPHPHMSQAPADLPEGVPPAPAPTPGGAVGPEPEPELPLLEPEPEGKDPAPVSELESGGMKLRVGGWELFESGGRLLLFHQESGSRGVLAAGEGIAGERIALDFPFESFGASWRPETLPDKSAFVIGRAGFGSLSPGEVRQWGVRRGGHCWNIALATQWIAKRGAKTVELARGAVVSAGGRWGKVLSDYYSSVGIRICKVEWLDGSDETERVPAKTFGSKVFGSRSDLEELTGGVTITSAVVDALKASHKDATQSSETNPRRSELESGGMKLRLGDREAIAESEMGLVLTTDDRGAETAPGLIPGTTLRHVVDDGSTTEDDFTVGIDQPSEALSRYRLVLQPDGGMDFTDERGRNHTATLFAEGDPVAAIASPFVAASSDVGSGADSHSDSVSVSVSSQKWCPGWVVGEATTSEVSIAETVHAALSSHEAAFERDDLALKTYRKKKVKGTMTDSEFADKLTAMFPIFPAGPWKEKTTISSLAAYWQAATQGTPGAQQEPASIRESFRQSNQDCRSMLASVAKFDTGTPQTPQSFLVLTHMNSKAEVGLWADGQGGCSVRFRHKDDRGTAYVHENKPKPRESNGMPEPGAFAALRHCRGLPAYVSPQEALTRGVQKRYYNTKSPSRPFKMVPIQKPIRSPWLPYLDTGHSMVWKGDWSIRCLHGGAVAVHSKRHYGTRSLFLSGDGRVELNGRVLGAGGSSELLATPRRHGLTLEPVEFGDDDDGVPLIGQRTVPYQVKRLFGDELLAPEPEREQPTSAAGSTEPERWRTEGTEWGAPPQEQKIIELIRSESLQDAAPLYHFFLGHRQVGGGAQVGELDALLTHRFGLKCWRDLRQAEQDINAMIRGVAQSSVYMLYLTRGEGSLDALSYFVTIEARAAMKLKKPVIVLMENDERKPSYAGGIERGTAGWPSDLCEYFQTGRYVAWGGEPYEWSEADMDAKLKTILERCKTVNPLVPSGATSWTSALDVLVKE